jgi:CubicO group peptidase (beta-lactamase class C family)
MCPRIANATITVGSQMYGTVMIQTLAGPSRKILIANAMNRSIPSRLAAGVFALALAASTPVAAQRHFPSDEAVREIARGAGTVSGKVGIVIGELEADGSRRVITVSDAPYDGRTLFEIGSITKVFTGILLAEMAERGEVHLEQPVVELLPRDVVVPATRSSGQRP